MSKVNQLIEYIIQDIIAFMVEDSTVAFDEAMRHFYMSMTFSKLQDEETGLYLQSSAYVYEIYKGEVLNGIMVQDEQ